MVINRATGSPHRIEVPISSPSTAITARGAGVGATNALVDKREQAVTVPRAQAFFPLFLATDFTSGDKSTMATSPNTGMATKNPVAARAAVEFFFPTSLRRDVAILWQALDFSR